MIKCTTQHVRACVYVYVSVWETKWMTARKIYSGWQIFRTLEEIFALKIFLSVGVKTRGMQSHRVSVYMCAWLYLNGEWFIGKFFGVRGRKFIVIESGEKLISFLSQNRHVRMEAKLTRRTLLASVLKYLIGFSSSVTTFSWYQRWLLRDERSLKYLFSCYHFWWIIAEKDKKRMRTSHVDHDLDWWCKIKLHSVTLFYSDLSHGTSFPKAYSLQP